MSPESQMIEWKATWRDEYLKWVSGFANADGGTLVIGRDDKGKACGLPNVAKLLEDLPNKIRDLMGIVVDIHQREEAGGVYLEIEVPPYPTPISYRGRYYKRTGSTNQELKGAALDRFLLGRHGRTWDSVPVPGVSVEDLSPHAVEEFKSLAATRGRVERGLLQETLPGLVEKLKLVEGTYLNRAALLLFHHDPERFFTGAYIKVGYFLTESDLAYHDEIRGNLFAQAEKTVDLILTKYFKATIRYQGIQRIERYPVPETALREALLNAVVHRDYSVPAPIQIRVYDDRIKIWNPAVLPEGWDLAKLLGEHSSHPYNPTVANVFFRAGEIEAWGRGIRHIFRACHENTSPEPIVHHLGNDLWMEFPYHPDCLGNAQEIDPTTQENRGTVTKTGTTTPKTPPTTPKTITKTGSTTPKTPPTTPKTITKSTQETESATQDTTQNLILATLGNEPKTSSTELGKQLGISRNGIRYHLNQLKKAGKLRHVGPAKGGHWEVLD